MCAGMHTCMHCKNTLVILVEKSEGHHCTACEVQIRQSSIICPAPARYKKYCVVYSAIDLEINKFKVFCICSASKYIIHVHIICSLRLATIIQVEEYLEKSVYSQSLTAFAIIILYP